MTSLHIRDIKPETLAGLKRLARQHNRSLQGELRAILERASRLAPPEEAVKLNLTTVKGSGESSWSRDQIYDDSGR